MSVPTLEDVLACPNLPSLPAVAIEIIDLTRDENVRIDEITKVVQNDPALTAKILKTVNSPLYALSKPCPTIARALTYLGLSTVKALVLGFSLVDESRGGEDGIDLTEYWRRCLYSAAAARRIAARTGGCDADEAFVAALMQDIGMLAISATAGAEYTAVVAAAHGDHRRLAPIERERLGFDHAEAGAALGTRWRLPAHLIEAIRHHHDPGLNESDALVHTVSLSCEVATTMCLSNPGAALASMQAHAKSWTGLTTDDVEALLHATVEDAAELGQLFSVSTGSPPDVNRLLAAAEDASLAHQINVHREREDLRRTNDELARQATTDGLTNVGNRARFDTELGERFEQAKAFNGSVGLIIADADRFKNLNDTYGHQAGDAVLVEIARRLADAVRGVDVVCRYGGEEFAVILPGATLRDVAMIAERLRLSVGDEPIDVVGVPGAEGPLDVNISLGAAVYGPETAGVLGTPERLIKAADRALYAAKEGGRNCVRVFSMPRRGKAA